VTKPRVRWQAAVMRDDVDFFKIFRCKVAVRNRGIWRLRAG